MEHDAEFHIDPFGQQAGLWNLYTQLTFCYPMDDNVSQDNVVKTLSSGLAFLTTNFPWISGQVVKQTTGNDIPEYYVIKRFEPLPQLIVRDHCHDLPSFSQYERLRFPISLLDENVVAPRNTKSTSAESDPKPVFLIQATFITDGVLLTFAAQHGTMDIVGQYEVIRLLDRACHKIQFTTEELKQGNRDRRSVVQLSDENDKPKLSQPDKDERSFSHQRRTVSDVGNASVPQPTASPVSENVWANFMFPSTSLRALKDLALEDAPSFVSTDDSLSAFIWRCVSKARTPLLKLTESTKFERAVDVRRYVGVPSIYPGNLATKVFTTYNVDELLSQSLGVVASKLRSGIDPQTADISSKVRAVVFASRSTAKQDRPTKSPRDLSKDVSFSSWVKIDACYELDFDLQLGKPAAVRRPSFAPPNEQPMEGVVYLLPRQPDGAIVVTMCLKESEMDKLRSDEEWTKYVEYIG